MESSTTNARGRASIGRWFARVLAVLAVAGAGLALYLVITGSDLTGNDEGKGGQKTAQSKEQKQEPQKVPEQYVVQPGDTIDGIAAKFGIPPSRIEQLNPQIDPQALPSGATLKLRS